MNGFITTNLQENEIVKASDVQLGGDNGIENLEKFYKVLLKADKNTVIGGKIRPVTDGSGLKAKMDPIMGIHAETEKVFMDHEGKFYLDGDKDLSDIISFADAETDIRRDIVEVKADTITALEQSRQFYNPDTETTSYSFTDIQKRQILRLKVKKGITGSDVAPETDEGYVKLCEVVIPAYTLSLEDSNILNITADESNGENSAWTIEKDSTVNPGTIKDIKDIFRTIHNADGTLKNNVVSAEKILLSGEGALRGSIIEIGGGNVVINGVTYGPSTSISDIIATLNNKVIPVSQGGTGATTQVEAQHNLFDNTMVDLRSQPLGDGYHLLGWYSSNYEDPLLYNITLGDIKNHFANTFLKKDGASYSDSLMIIPNGYNGYNEGIRIGKAPNGWSNIQFGCANTTISGTVEGQWLVGSSGGNAYLSPGDFVIEHNNSMGNGLVLSKDASYVRWWGVDLATRWMTKKGKFTKDWGDYFGASACLIGDGIQREASIGFWNDCGQWVLGAGTADEANVFGLWDSNNRHNIFTVGTDGYCRSSGYYTTYPPYSAGISSVFVDSGDGFIGKRSVSEFMSTMNIMKRSGIETTNHFQININSDDGGWCEGIRIAKTSGTTGYAGIFLNCDPNADRGYVDNQWNIVTIGTDINNNWGTRLANIGDIGIWHKNDNAGAALYLHKDGSSPKWGSRTVAMLDDTVAGASLANYLTMFYSDKVTGYASGMFIYEGQGGQPSWLWGTNDGKEMRVYNPANFSVNHATFSDVTWQSRTLSLWAGDNYEARTEAKFHWEGREGQPTWMWGCPDDGKNMYVYDPSNFNVNHAHHSSQLKSLDGVPGALIVGVFIPSFNGVQYNVAGSLVTSTYYEDQYGKHYRVHIDNNVGLLVASNSGGVAHWSPRAYIEISPDAYTVLATTINPGVGSSN